MLALWRERGRACALFLYRVFFHLPTEVIYEVRDPLLVCKLYHTVSTDTMADNEDEWIAVNEELEQHDGLDLNMASLNDMAEALRKFEGKKQELIEDIRMLRVRLEEEKVLRNAKCGFIYLHSAQHTGALGVMYSIKIQAVSVVSRPSRQDVDYL